MGAANILRLENGTFANRSKRAEWRRVYECFNDIARPGDVVFFISERPIDLSRSVLRLLYRKWQGFADDDPSRWHTAMYTGSRKESRGSATRSYFIHAVERGVEEIHVPPSYFTNIRSDGGEMVQGGRIEVSKDPCMMPEQRVEIIDYIRERLSQPFADLDWKQDILTWALGLPARKLDPNKASCHGIVFEAYEHVGYSFQNHLDTAPWFNIGRHLGHPLWGTREKADLTKLHLHDHHLYRDPRFICVLSIYEDQESGEIKIVENPGKYSWNPELQKKYGV
jgi:hypothetical protein